MCNESARDSVRVTEENGDNGITVEEKDDKLIVKGVNIKRGSVIGAKAVVNKSTEENGVYVGIPAKLLKNRK